MPQVLAVLPENEEVIALKLARDIAMDFHDIEAVLATNGVTPERYEELKTNPYFRALLQSEVAAWCAATNANERVKLKAAAMIEEWLPEANARAHDGKETLSSKVELMKLVKSLTSMGVTHANESGGERLNITINLGADSPQLKYEKVVPKTIDAEALLDK